MMNVLRGLGYVLYGVGFFLKNAILFVLIPWTTSRRWSKNADTSASKDEIRFLFPGIYSVVSTIAGIATAANLGTWYITLLIMVATAISGLYELGRAFAPPKAKVTNKEDGMNPTETHADPTAPSAGYNPYEREMQGLKKALDEDGKSIKRRNWIIGGILTIIILFGAAVGYLLEKGVLVVEVDGVSMAQELEKAQAELERLKGEIPALEDAKKKLDEMMEKAKEMIPPGILPPDKEKKDDF